MEIFTNNIQITMWQYNLFRIPTQWIPNLEYDIKILQTCIAYSFHRPSYQVLSASLRASIFWKYLGRQIRDLENTRLKICLLIRTRNNNWNDQLFQVAKRERTSFINHLRIRNFEKYSEVVILLSVLTRMVCVRSTNVKINDQWRRIGGKCKVHSKTCNLYGSQKPQKLISQKLLRVIT